LLGPDGNPPQVQKWYDRLAPLVASAQDRLREMETARLVERSGCTQDAAGTLRLAFLRQPYLVRWPGFTIWRPDGAEVSDFIQALILTYLVSADGTAPSGRWIAYRDLPGGMFYAQAFRGYAENRLIRELGKEGRAAFCRGARRLDGKLITIGSAGYAFQVLPCIHLAAVYWEGDEDFGAQASILFEDSAPHYLSTEGLAVLGSHLVNAILEAAREA
jgi:hypothetical protein